jgi:hypothetical protein
MVRDHVMEGMHIAKPAATHEWREARELLQINPGGEAASAPGACA